MRVPVIEIEALSSQRTAAFLLPVPLVPNRDYVRTRGGFYTRGGLYENKPLFALWDHRVPAKNQTLFSASPKAHRHGVVG